jgi:hypothetical protein
MGFADVLGAIDAGTSAGTSKEASKTPRLYVAPKGAFSGVIDSVDSGGNSGAAPEDSKVARNIRTPEAFGRGVASGVTANFYDELRGLHEAGGAGPDEPMSLSSVLKGAFLKATGDKEASQKYDTAATRERQLNQQAEEQHPVASTVGDVAGSMLVPVGGAAGGATLGARALKSAAAGAAYGGLAGAGEGVGATDTATRATTGAILGGAIGGVAAPVVEGALQLGKAALAPISGLARGIFKPDNEAAMRITGAIKKDVDTDPAARNRLTPQEFAASKQAGTPVAAIDLGGESTKALARSSANTSPEARQILNDTIDQRFEGQSGRMVDWLRSTFHYPDAQAQQEAIDQTAKTVNRARYAKAFQEGDKEIYSPELDRLMGSPAFVDAMRRASTSGKDRAITQGLGAMRQGVTVENGVVKFTKGPNGVPTYPNLQFWDATKRELDDAASSASRAGRNGEASVIGDLSKKLRGELDATVPSYASARAGAAHFFGASDALEAGQNFVTARMQNAQARATLAKMSPTERQLFQDGFVSRFVQHLNEVGDRRSVLNKIAQSPAARERLSIALGPQKAGELEATLRVEGIMDTARKAVQGNSTTARQWVELGLASGTSGIGLYNQDPKQVAYSGIATALVAGKNHINQQLARRVAEMLTSNDPKLLVKGAQLVARNSNIMNGLRSLDKRLAAAGGESAPNGLIAAGTAPSRADDNQPNR